MSKKEVLHMFRNVNLYFHSSSVVNEIKQKKIKTAVMINCCQIGTSELIRWFGINFSFTNNQVTYGGIVTRILIFHITNLIVQDTKCRIHSICRICFLEFLIKRLNIPTNKVIAVADEAIDSFLPERNEVEIDLNASLDIQNHSVISIRDLLIILEFG